jgi:pantetheine-phosphate adenylyltransferase
MFTAEQRESFVRQSFSGHPRIQVMIYQKLTVDFCKEIDAEWILRGLRNYTDYEYEAAIARMNREMANDIETVFMVCAPQYAAISSTIVREIIRNGGDVSRFVGFSL